MKFTIFTKVFIIQKSVQQIGSWKKLQHTGRSQIKAFALQNSLSELYDRLLKLHGIVPVPWLAGLVFINYNCFCNKAIVFSLIDFCFLIKRTPQQTWNSLPTHEKFWSLYSLAKENKKDAKINDPKCNSEFTNIPANTFFLSSPSSNF